MDAFMKELAHTINTSETKDQSVVCMSLIHTSFKYLMSDENPKDSGVSVEKRKETALQFLNMILETYEQKLEFV